MSHRTPAALGSAVLLSTALALTAATASSATADPARPASAQLAVAAAGPVVQGAILAHYQALGGSRGFLGLPLTDELPTPYAPGAYNDFQGGSIYWSPATGAWEVHGGIRDHWGSLGAEGGLLGFPVADEQRLVAQGGAVSRFQRGSVYWSPATSAHEVHGEILRTYGALGGEAGRLGYPVSDERPTKTQPGAYSAFERGAVYWSPATGAHEVEGAIRALWESLGGEEGLGFPVSDEGDMPGGRVSEFERGQVQWTPERGALVTRGVASVSRADVAARTVTLDAFRHTYTWDANDEFAVVPAGSEDEPQRLTRRQFQRTLAAELASPRARPMLVIDYAVERAGTSRFTLLLQSEGGLTAQQVQDAYTRS